MDQLPREAVKSGDVGILDAMEKARSSRSDQGRLFERSKLVRDIVQNEDLTNEQFANSILSLGPKSGAYVKDILNAASNDPTKQQELQSQIKQAVLGSIVNKSLSSEAKAGSTVDGVENMVSFDKLSTNLDRLTGNKTLFEKVIPDASERETISKISNAAKLIKSQKPGTKNYSNSAYTLLNVIRSISPTAASANVLGVGVGSGLKAAGQSGALNELQQSVAPVLKKMADSSNIITNFGTKYGRRIMSGAAEAGTNAQTDKVLRVTVPYSSEKDKK
jgi:hypothetical protein